MKFLALTLLVVIFFCLGFTWGTVESIGYIKAKCDSVKVFNIDAQLYACEKKEDS